MRVAPVHVVAGALIDRAGRILIAERPAGKAHAGRWEFPGGKLKGGESPRDGLARELAEELGIELLKCAPLLTVTHHYPGAPAPTLIDCWTVELWRGTPESLDGQRLRWCTRAELASADILEADRAIVTALRLPRLFLRAGGPGGRPRPGAGRERVGWLLEGAAAARPPAAGEGDALFLVDPTDAPPPGAGALYRDPARARAGAAGGEPSGAVVASGAEARAALTAGADFLVVIDRAGAAEELEAIAATGLPWYLNVAAAGSGDAPAPTGRVWWPTP